jgi:hypothetical protein
MRALSVRCRLCDRFVPRWPHLMVIGLLVITVLAGVIALLEVLAKSH